MKKTAKVLTLISSLALCAGFVGAGFGSLNADAATSETPDLYTHGGSVRKIDPTGLRFLSSVSEEYKDAEEVGTIIILKAALEGQELTHNENLLYEEVVSTQWSNEAVAEMDGFEYEADRYYFNAVLNPIPNQFYGAPIVARAYVKTESGYIYGEPVERSIAQVAAAALAAGEKDPNGKLVDYVDTALGGKTLSMSTQIAYMEVGDEQTLEVSNGYKAIWSSDNEDVVSVDQNGKVTAKAEGNATVTAKLGSTNVTANIQVGSFEGEKVVDFTADNVTSKATAGNNITLSNQDGMLKAAYSDYSGNCSMTVTPLATVFGYDQIQFAVYNAQNKGIGLYVNDTFIQNIHFGWNVVTVDVSTLSNTTKLWINIHQSAWNSMANDVYYFTDIYGVASAGAIVDFTADNVTSKATAGNNITLSSQDGMLKAAYSDYSGNCSMTVTPLATVFGYDQIQFAVYNAQNKGIGLYVNDTFIQNINAGWNIVTVDVSSLSNTTKLSINIHQSAWNSMANDVYYFTDIYGVASAGAIVDFTADNVTSKATAGNNITLSNQDGMLKSAYSNYSGNCSMTVTMKEVTDISGYTQIKFAVYNAQNKGIGLYVNDTFIQNINAGWNIVTVDVSSLSNTTKLSINIHQSAWNSMANDIYYFTDIFGI